MDTATSEPRVLVIGLDPYRVPGPWDPEPVAAAIEAGLTRFAEHGVGVETCLVGLDGSDDVESVVGAALRSRPWECVGHLIGMNRVLAALLADEPLHRRDRAVVSSRTLQLEPVRPAPTGSSARLAEPPTRSAR